MSNEEERFKRHLGKCSDIKVDGEVFKMKPLGGGHLPKFFKVLGKLAELDEDATTEQITGAFTEENVKDIMELMVEGFVSANPTVGKETLTEFVGANFWDLFQPFIEINGMKDTNKKELNAKIKELQDKRKGGTNATDGSAAVPHESETKETE